MVMKVISLRLLQASLEPLVDACSLNGCARAKSSDGMVWARPQKVTRPILEGYAMVRLKRRRKNKLKMPRLNRSRSARKVWLQQKKSLAVGMGVNERGSLLRAVAVAVSVSSALCPRTEGYGSITLRISVPSQPSKACAIEFELAVLSWFAYGEYMRSGVGPSHCDVMLRTPLLFPLLIPSRNPSKQRFFKYTGL
jgi:hypothetical protein